MNYGQPKAIYWRISTTKIKLPRTRARLYTSLTSAPNRFSWLFPQANKMPSGETHNSNAVGSLL
jgi:hypothetical protein